MAEFHFVKAFQPEPDNNFSYLYDLRSHALEYYRAQPFPDAATPGWRKVSYQDLQTQAYRLPEANTPTLEQPALDMPVLYSNDMLVVQRVFAQNGNRFFVSKTLEKGMMCGLTSDPSMKFPRKIIEKIGQIIPPTSDKFTAFGYAFAQDSAVLFIDEGVEVKTPLFYQENFQGEKTGDTLFNLDLPGSEFFCHSHPAAKKCGILRYIQRRSDGNISGRRSQAGYS